MKRLNNMELTSINGGSPLEEFWGTDYIRNFIDFCKGFKKGWKSC